MVMEHSIITTRQTKQMVLCPQETIQTLALAIMQLIQLELRTTQMELLQLTILSHLVTAQIKQKLKAMPPMERSLLTILSYLVTTQTK